MRVKRLSKIERRFVETLLREDRLTLDEMMDAIRAKFPDVRLSRSALHRYQSSIAELGARMREIDRAAEVLVGEFGSDIGEKAGALLAQAVTTLATNAALRAQEDPEVSIDEVRKMAVAAKHALDTRRLSLAERKEVERLAREALVREQKERLTTVAKKAGMSATTAEQIRREILGVA